MQEEKAERVKATKIKSACREINNLKQELREIKQLIKEIIK